ncbi:MAG: efflux RND transporter permease subunit, partial [Calditrichaeota bacterium]|nr:efflux RND transporter permease subunit [Calditrichota bacterium]
QGGLYPAGKIETSTTNFSLRIVSEYNNIENIRNAVIKYQKNTAVLVKDIAEVEDGFKEITGDVRADYHQGVFIRLFKQSDANTVQACRNVSEALPEIQNILPEDAELKIVYDQSEFILRSVTNLGNTAVLAFILAFLVMYFFLRNIRGSIIMGLAIPVSVISTFAVMMLGNLTLNIVSMAGLALAIGMLVDNSIVVLENIYRFREEGSSRVDAASRGASEVGMAITASTLTTIGVFFPVLFVPGIAGELFNDMVITITVSLFASLVIALTLVPMISSRILKSEKELKKSFFQGFKDSLGHFFEKLTQKYSKLLHWSLRHKIIILGSTFIALVLSIALIYVIGGEFLPRSDQGFIAIDISREKGTPLNQTRLTVLEIEKIVKQEVPEATDVFVIFGSGEGIAALFGGSGSEVINFRIRLTPMEDRSRSQFEIEDELRKKLDKIPGITYQFAQSASFMNQRAIQVKIFGYNIDQSLEIAEQMKTAMSKVPGLVDIDINLEQEGQELRIKPDRQRMNDLKLNPLQVADIISTSIQGRVAARYREVGDEYDVSVRLEKKYRNDKESLKNLMIPTISGKMIPLEQIAEIDQTEAPSRIYRENQQRYVAVSCDLSDEIDLSSAVDRIENIISETSIPADFQVVIGGSAEDQQESFFYLGLAFIAAIILVYMIMASQFESLVDPFIIMFTVPLSIIGVFFVLFITGTTLSVMALVGIVMLAGIVVNNGIVLVDYINQLHREGYDLYDAAERGGQIRFRPVLMTAMTTILGMVPLAFELGSGSENWSPLARAVIGGLTTSTFLTLIIIPVVYVIFERMGERVKAYMDRRI